MKKRLLLNMLLCIPMAFGCACGGDGGSSPSASSSSGEPPIQMTEEEWSKNGGYAYYHYSQLGRDVMPIGAWTAPPGPWSNYENQITRENYRVLSEVGLNSIYGLYDQAQNTPSLILDALDYCNEFGIVYLVRDTRMLAVGQEPDLIELFEEYQSKPAYGGNLVVDEPGTSLFGDLANLQRVWSNLEITANKLMYVNMLPSYASQNQLINGAGGGALSGSITYAEYLQRYVDTVHPSVLSFDFYPFDGFDATYFGHGYFEQLHDVKKCAEGANIPFWTFAQVGYFQTGEMRKMPEGELLWQVNTALAYGAKGIQYFSYWSPYEIGNLEAGFVSREGEKLYLYDYGVKANRQIKAIDEVLMKCANKGVIQVGNTPDAIPEEDKLLGFRELRSATGADALIGCFDYRGKTAFYVVSNNYNEGGEVVLNFASQINASIVQDGVKTNKIGNTLTLNLSAGEGVLVVLE